MHGQGLASWRRVVVGALLSGALLGQALASAPGAFATDSIQAERPVSGIRLDFLAWGYRAGGTLGFALQATPLDEQLYRRTDGSERGVLWSAEFASRWPLNQDQLDRWSAQVGGLVVDSLDPSLRLAAWERLAAHDLGEQRVAYRYTLADATGRPVGEATVVVFAHGNQVGMTATATMGTRAPVDATGLARALDAGPGGL
jgi:hypothetical protein